MSAIISDQNAFAQLCRELAQHSAFGLDTEFMRERTYFAQLCLLQLSFGERAVCIDTLALPDLSALRPAMASPAIGKVLHAARQDLEVLGPATGPLVGLCDTQVAAALIGLSAQVGYGELVKQLLGASLHKAETRTDWSRRPLSGAQIAYALDDVRYLQPLRERLTERLHIGRHILIGAALFDVTRDLGEEGLQRAAAVARQFAADQIERLNAVGALIDHRNTRIAHELFHAVLGDIAVAAEHLLGRDRVGEALVGEHAFDHRRHQAHVILGGLPLLGIFRAVRDVAFKRGPDHERARRFVEGADAEQHATHVGVNDDRIGRLLRKFGAR